MPVSPEIAERMMRRLMPHVERHDLFTFLVQSRARGGRRHLVSISANWGNGKCGCEDFEIRRNIALRKSGVPGVQYECWHIREAKRYWTYQTILATAPDEALAEGVLDPPPEVGPGESAF